MRKRYRLRRPARLSLVAMAATRERFRSAALAGRIAAAMARARPDAR